MTKFEGLLLSFMLILLALILFSVSDRSNFIINDNVSVTMVNPVDDRGNIEVSIQDQFTEIVDLRLSQKIADINITHNTLINDRFINISSDVLPLVDDLVCLKEKQAFYQGNILSVVSLGGNNYQIELDKPLDYAFTTLGGCSIREDNWAVDGSVTPQTFTVSPANMDDNVSWDITRLMLVCLGDGTSAPDPTPDLSSFFTMDAVSNGIVFRSVDGRTKNIFSANNNFHLVSETYDLTIYPANRFGFFGVTSRRTFNGADKNGVTIRLNAVSNDRFDFIIQDDLTDMEECHAVVQGHAVDV